MPTAAADFAGFASSLRLVNVGSDFLRTIERNRAPFMKPAFATFLDQHQKAVAQMWGPVAQEFARQGTALTGALEPFLKHATLASQAASVFESSSAIRQANEIQRAFHGLTGSLFQEVAKTLTFTDAFADLHATLRAVARQMEEPDAVATEEPGPLASQSYRARQAMRQALIVITFLAMGAVVEQPRTAQAIPSYLLTVYALVLAVGWAMGDDDD